MNIKNFLCNLYLWVFVPYIIQLQLYFKFYSQSNF